jgi:hypothetical protein
MDAQKVDMYLISNNKFFTPYQLGVLRDYLIKLDDSKSFALHSAELKDPTMMLIVSIIAGSLGIDRFLIGDTGMGIGKLLTCGGLGIWWLVDLFLIMDRTKEVNFNRTMALIV